MNEDKNMTINDLARLMQGEFLGVNKRFDDVDKRFGGVKEEFAGVKEEFAGVKEEFASVNRRLDGLETDVKFIKDNASELFTKLDEFITMYRDTKQELGLLAKQMKRLEERVAQLEGGR